MTTEDFKTKSNLQIFWYYMMKQKALFVLDMFCVLLYAFIDLIYPFISRYAMNKLLPQKSYTQFFAVVGIICVAYILKLIINYIFLYWGHRFGVLVEVEIKRDLFKHIQTMQFDFFDHNRTGSLMSRITTDLFEIMELAHHGPENILISVVTIVGSLILMARIEWRFTLILAAVIPIFIFILVKIQTRQRQVSAGVKISMSHINTQIESNLSGMKTGKAFANEEIEFNKFDDSVLMYRDAKKEYYKLMSVFQSSMEYFCCMLSVIVIGVGGWLIMDNKLNYVDLVTFTMYVNVFITPIRKLVNFSETYASGAAGFERFVEIMRTEPSIKDKENAKDLVVKEGKIKFENVNFSYDKEAGILKNINLTVNAGETLAVVGSSGGGKTTLCQLIPRFYEVDSGDITIDGVSIKDVTQESLHREIGIVQQDVFLFADTVMENIRYGRPDASDEEVIEAAKKAEIYEDVMNMPNGMETYVGERGALLSGGQKQRIAIARIFLKNPPILILDEATSALDSITEGNIQNAFDNLAVGRTCIIIAHRLSTIRKANRIIVIDDGEIKEEGTHAELLSKNGIYTKLYNSQHENLVK